MVWPLRPSSTGDLSRQLKAENNYVIPLRYLYKYDATTHVRLCTFAVLPCLQRCSVYTV